MQIALITGCVLAFVAILTLNIYFRVKVLRNYRTLVRHRIYFETAHFFDRRRMEDEVIARHPEYRETIEAFRDNILFSMKCAGALILTITALAAALMFFPSH
jgi:hypothetical protein